MAKKISELPVETPEATDPIVLQSASIGIGINSTVEEMINEVDRKKIKRLPHCFVKRIGDQAILSSDWNVVEYNEVVSDPDSWFSGGAITVPSDGLYMIFVQLSIQSLGGDRQFLGKIPINNDGLQADACAYYDSGSGVSGVLQMEQILVLTSGDVISSEVYQNTGADKNLLGSDKYNEITSLRVVKVANG